VSLSLWLTRDPPEAPPPIVAPIFVIAFILAL
jgi:hypothetical protein